VLGFYESSDGYEFTPSAKQFDEDCQGNLERLLKLYVPTATTFVNRGIACVTHYDEK